MEYGLGAQDVPAPGAIDFERAIAHIWEIEKRFNLHGTNVREQSQLRDNENPGTGSPAGSTPNHNH